MPQSRLGARCPRRRASVSRPVLPPLAGLLALLAVLHGASAVLTHEERQAALIGWTEADPVDAIACVNADSRCATWAARGECFRNAGYMRATCLAACRVAPQCIRTIDVWPGHATPDGTARYALAGLGFSPSRSHFRRAAYHTASGGNAAASKHLMLSSIGIGTYLGQATDAEDTTVTDAVIRAAAEGLNVIDSASNYRDGRGEVSVGRALHALRTTAGLERDQLFVSTKAGFIGMPDIFTKLQAAGKISAEDVVGGIHCFHPACLQASLEESLQRLRLATVDLLYLHNPAEMWLESLGRDQFLKRLRVAFKWAEGERAKGRLRTYGMATWSSLRLPPGQAGHLELQDAVDVAKAVGGENHGFRFIQLPVSAGMPEAFSQDWQTVTRPDGATLQVSILDAARGLGLGVFGSGPLMEGQLMSDSEVLQALEKLPEVSNVLGNAARLLQLARSTPGLVTAIVGMKLPVHIDEDAQLTHIDVLTPAKFHSAMDALASAKQHTTAV